MRRELKFQTPHDIIVEIPWVVVGVVCGENSLILVQLPEVYQLHISVRRNLIMESYMVENCGTAVQGNSPLIFHQLIHALLVSQCTLSSPNDYAPHRIPEILNNPDQHFDFIIVGGGTAGSVLANRLSENKDWKVLLIETGTHPSATSDVPGMFLELLGSAEDYQYILEYQDNICKGIVDNRCRWGKGRVLGGSSVVNAMLHVHGTDQDYDSWAALGNDGWGFQDVLPYFKKSENYPPEFIEKYGDKYVGSNGQINIRSYNYSDTAIQEVILEAIKEKGLPQLENINGDKYIGFGKAYGTLDNGRRMNVARAYLSPLKDRKNLFILTSTRADKILMDGNTAIGVRVSLPNGESIDLKASKEVIISAGSIGTPQILMLSGIGPKEHLNEFGIPCVADLPVGKNLQDHLVWLGLQLEFFNESTVIKTPLDFLDEAYTYFLHKKGEFATIGGSDLLGFVNLEDPMSKYPNIQFHNIYIPRGYLLKTEVMARGFGLSEDVKTEFVRLTAASDSFLMAPTLLKPKSVGEIKLRSNSPADPVRIWANYLTNDDDTRTMLNTVNFIKSLEQTEIFKKYGIKLRHFKISGCKEFDMDSMEYWECNLRHIAGTIFHPVGTAKMGPSNDPTAVVDPKLKVHGVHALRVIDGSIMPTITSGNTNSPVLMIAEKSADMIKNEWRSKDEL